MPTCKGVLPQAVMAVLPLGYIFYFLNKRKYWLFAFIVKLNRHETKEIIVECKIIANCVYNKNKTDVGTPSNPRPP